MHIEWIQDYARFQTLREPWNALAQQARAGLFLRHEWFDAAWQWLAQAPANPQLNIALVYDGDRSAQRLIAVMPLISQCEHRYSLALRTFSFLHIPDTQQCDILCLPDQEHAQLCGTALGQALLDRRAEWDVLRLDFVPASSAAIGALMARLQGTGMGIAASDFGTNWSIDLQQGWSTYYNARPRALKKANNLVSNRLEQTGKLDIEWQRIAPEGANAQTVLDRIAPISTGSWKAGTGNTLDRPGPRQFLQRLTAHALREQWLSLWLLKCDGRTIAYEYQVAYEGSIHALRADYLQETDAALSPGAYLNFKLLQQLFAAPECRHYCMGPGNNGYKLKWTAGGQRLLRHVAVGDSWRARLFGLIELKGLPLLRWLRHMGNGGTAEPGSKMTVVKSAAKPAAVKQEQNDAVKKPTPPAQAVLSVPSLSTQTRQGWVGAIQPGQNTVALTEQLSRMAHTLSCTTQAPELQIAASSRPGMALGWTAHTWVGQASGQWGECFVWGHPHLRSRLPDAVASLRDLNQAANILERKLGSEGSAAFDVLRGSFAAIAVSHDRRHVFLAVDPMGVGRLHYACQQDQVWVATRSDSIVPVLAQATLNPQALYNYMFLHAVGAPQTMHKEIHQVPAGCAVYLHGGKAEVSRYWDFRFGEDAHDFAQLQTEFVELLQDVHRPYARVEHAGTFLSGGTDSSTVCGMLGRVSGKPATSYSIGFQAEGYDEIGFAATAAKHFGADHRVYYVTPDDVVNTIDIVARTYDQPFGNASAVPVYWCARRAAQDGMRLLLAGDGGDELFGGNTRYATQWLLSLFGNLPAPLRSAAVAAANKTPDGLSLLSKAASYVRQANIPMPDRMQNYNLVARIGAHTIFAPELLREIDLHYPYEEQRRIYRSAPANSLINRMLWLDWKYTLADSDLPKVSGMCEAAGMQVAYPLLDNRMIEFSAKLAPDLKLRRTYLRYFFKRALWDFLPQSTLTKSKQGFGLPFGVWLTHHAPLRERAYESLRSLDQRGVLADGFIKHIVAQHQTGHAAYYGTLIWVLMMLEAWFANQT